MNDETSNPVLTTIWLIALVASLIHVFLQSRRDKQVGTPIRHTLMVALVIWPVSYLCWLLWWPGSLRQWLFGSDKERIKKEVDRAFGSFPPTDQSSSHTGQRSSEAAPCGSPDDPSL